MLGKHSTRRASNTPKRRRASNTPKRRREGAKPLPSNMKLYQRVKNKSNRIFHKTGLGRSKWIVNEYIKEGGTYKGKHPKNSRLSQGFRRWNHQGRKTKLCRRGQK